MVTIKYSLKTTLPFNFFTSSPPYAPPCQSQYFSYKLNFAHFMDRICRLRTWPLMRMAPSRKSTTPHPPPKRESSPSKKNPERPERPGNPECPEYPENPENPENPEYPERPENPEYPENSFKIYLGRRVALLAARFRHEVRHSHAQGE